jgi:dynein heavy chain
MKAVIDGIPILLRDVGLKVPMEFEALMNRNVKTLSDGRKTLMISDKQEISYNENFRFYLSTRLTNPYYNPELTAKVTLVNFQVKKEGLQE